MVKPHKTTEQSKRLTDRHLNHFPFKNYLQHFKATRKKTKRFTMRENNGNTQKITPGHDDHETEEDEEASTR